MRIDIITLRLTGLDALLQLMTYNAPFFTTWFCTNWTVLFFPLYFFCQLGSPNYQTPTDMLGESVRNFRDRGFTAAHFLTRCCMFCMLWVFTNYLYIHALSILVATDALALFAINVCCVYLLSWVILHDQFVGVRVSVSARTPAAVPPPIHHQNQRPVSPSRSHDNMALVVVGWRRWRLQGVEATGAMAPARITHGTTAMPLSSPIGRSLRCI